MASQLESRAEKFAAAAMSSCSDEELGQSMNSYYDDVSRASKTDAAASLAIMAPALEAPDLDRAALVANVCGAVVETGVSSSGIAQPLIQRMRRALTASRRFLDACMEEASRASKHAPDAGNGDDGEDGPDLDAIMERRAESMPEEAREWLVVQAFYLPLIAVFSYDAAARASAVDLLENAAEIAQYNQGGHWLTRMLKVFASEPYVAIEPATESGITGKICGISDNFQLNMFLMAVFPQKGMFAKRRVSKAVEQVIRGTGPQVSEEVVTGHWNLYTYGALEDDLTLGDAKDNFSYKSQHWVWNEGVPADIPVLDGHRVILLGPPSYSRSWRGQRDFNHLKADLTVEKKLSAAEVKDWLKKIAAAPKPTE